MLVYIVTGHHEWEANYGPIDWKLVTSDAEKAREYYEDLDAEVKYLIEAGEGYHQILDHRHKWDSLPCTED